jgi:hypothetical protein
LKIEKVPLKQNFKKIMSETLPQLFKSQHIPLEPLPSNLFQQWNQILTSLFDQKKAASSPDSCWEAIEKEKISNAMNFVLSTSHEYNCRFTVHILELLFSQIDPIARAREIRDVAWKLNSNKNTNDSAATLLVEVKNVIDSSCRRLLSGLFLVSDILMNATTENNNDRTIRSIIISFFDLNHFIQQLAEFVVMAKRKEIHEQEAKMDKTIAQNHHQHHVLLFLNMNSTANKDGKEDSISVIVGWIRELWKLWKSTSGMLPQQFIEKMESSFGFLLMTPQPIVNK